MEIREQSQIIENSMDIELPLETASVLAPIVNKLVNYEISTGIRDDKYDPENAENNDIIDEVQRSLNIGITQKGSTVLNLTSSEWVNIKQHISEAAENKVFSPEDLFGFESISDRMSIAFAEAKKPKKRETESAISWAQRRASKLSKSREIPWD